MNIGQAAQRWDSNMDRDFPVKVNRYEYREPGPIFESHWHEQFQVMCFEQGEAVIYCNFRPIRVGPGELVVINGKDVHYGENLGRQLVYYLVKIDLSFLLSNQLDLCQTKYMAPLLESHILFHNQVARDDELWEQVRQIIEEYRQKETGYELAVKAAIYRVLVLLLRRHRAQAVNGTELERKRATVGYLLPVLDYVEEHYNEKISLAQLAAIANISICHFCRLFKKTTGKPPTEYINYLRINRAAALLREGGLNISEVAMIVGINDSNYFSRLFKKYKQISPSQARSARGDGP